MGLDIIRLITTVAGIYQFMLILYGLNIYWRLYLPMFFADLLDACCRPKRHSRCCRQRCLSVLVALTDAGRTTRSLRGSPK